MADKPIKKVTPLENCVLRVEFETNGCILMDFKPRLKASRFGILSRPEVWDSVDTDGNFIHWYDRARFALPVAEMAYIELLQETVGMKNI